MAANSTTSAAACNFLRTHPELREFVLPNVVNTDEEIGRGSYGSVVLVKMPGASCAAKLINPSGSDAEGPGQQTHHPVRGRMQAHEHASTSAYCPVSGYHVYPGFPTSIPCSCHGANDDKPT